MGRTIIIAQARMSSTRLPGKVMADLGGKAVVDRVVARARASRLADDVLVATTTDATDDVLVEHLEVSGVGYVRGSLDDVLARYIQAAEKSRAQTIVRVTCDCPLIDPEVIDAAIAAFGESPEVDYCSNVLRRTYPIGMDVEVFSRQVLERAHADATLLGEREHVTPYIYQHPELFRLRNVEAPDWAKWPELRLTVDEDADIEVLREIVRLVPAESGLRHILEVIRAHPNVAAGNAAVAHRHVEKPRQW
ncbi:MAG: glycosyltransferase family protein [Actinomycetota bacterium]|jgi:spore coat polysaccharide biosynthesis protein SpsF|nr:glycosyltransferase family protein [Actinomycetota bacterium]